MVLHKPLAWVLPVHSEQADVSIVCRAVVFSGRRHDLSGTDSVFCAMIHISRATPVAESLLRDDGHDTDLRCGPVAFIQETGKRRQPKDGTADGGKKVRPRDLVDNMFRCERTYQLAVRVVVGKQLKACAEEQPCQQPPRSLCPMRSVRSMFHSLHVQAAL